MRAEYRCEDCGAEFGATVTEPSCPECGSQSVRENPLGNTDAEDDDIFFLHEDGFFDDLL